MNIELNLLREVITDMVDTINNQLAGKVQPSMSKYEAIKELGVISALVIGLYERTDDENLRTKIWNLKEKSDDMIQKLMGF